jgi:peptidoglycan/xylan/chitin deacetylase (PgdA/CDA1 family)
VVGGGALVLTSVGPAGGSIVTVGNTFIVNYTVNNTSSGPVSVSLRASLAPAGQQGFGAFSDAANEAIVSVPVGTSTVSRQFAVPTTAGEGGYDVTWSLVNTSNGSVYDTRTKKSHLWLKTSGVTNDNLKISSASLGSSSFTVQSNVVNRINGTFTINNPGSSAARAVVKMRIRLAGSGTWISDWMNDVMVMVPPGTSSFTRSYAVPRYVASGSYDVQWTLSRPDFSGDIDNSFQFGVLTISNPVRITNVGVPILMYHNVDTPAYTGIWVTIENFTQQMDYLKNNGYNPITGDDLYNYVYKGVALPSKPVWITMDDSAQNLYDNAYPILKARGQKGSIYTVTGFAGQMNTWRTGSEPEHPHLTWDMSRVLNTEGLLADGHTRGHVHLPLLTLDGQQAEVWGSERDLVENIGTPGPSFSYPFGEYTDGSMWLTAHSGYRSGVTTRSGRQYTDGADLFQLNRIYISKDDTLSTFISKLTAP